jgi:hypothetical protein
MSLPYEGDSSDPNVAGIIGKNTAGGIGVSGTGGPAGFFEGDVAVTGNITAQDIILANQISVGSTPNPGAVVVNDSQGHAGVKLNGGTVGGSISVLGTATIGDTLSVTGKVSALGDLTIAGNVGIGTINPQHRLQIGDDVDGISFDPGASPNAGVFRFGDHTGWKLHFGRSREASGSVPNSGVNGSLMTIQDNGNVGIGTVSPRSVLELEASAPGTLGPSFTLTNIGGGSNAAAAIDLNTFLPASSGTYNPSSRIEAVDDGNFANDIRFLSNTPGAANNGLVETMRITPVGVGIGTTGTNARLEVVQSGTNDGIRVSGGVNPLVATTDGTVKAKLQVITSKSGLVGTETNHNFGIYTNNGERVTITAVQDNR